MILRAIERIAENFSSSMASGTKILYKVFTGMGGGNFIFWWVVQNFYILQGYTLEHSERVMKQNKSNIFGRERREVGREVTWEWELSV